MSTASAPGGGRVPNESGCTWALGRVSVVPSLLRSPIKWGGEIALLLKSSNSGHRSSCRALRSFAVVGVGAFHRSLAGSSQMEAAQLIRCHRLLSILVASSGLLLTPWCRLACPPLQTGHCLSMPPSSCLCCFLCLGFPSPPFIS